MKRLNVRPNKREKCARYHKFSFENPYNIFELKKVNIKNKNKTNSRFEFNARGDMPSNKNEAT